MLKRTFFQFFVRKVFRLYQGCVVKAFRICPTMAEATVAFVFLGESGFVKVAVFAFALLTFSA